MWIMLYLILTSSDTSVTVNNQCAMPPSNPRWRQGPSGRTYPEMRKNQGQGEASKALLLYVLTRGEGGSRVIFFAVRPKSDTI